MVVCLAVHNVGGMSAAKMLAKRDQVDEIFRESTRKASLESNICL